MSALVYGIVRSATAGWTEPETLTAVVAGVVLLALFVLVEWRAKQPIMPLWLVADRERAGAYAVRVLFLGAMVAFWFFTSQFLQNVSGFSPLLAGVAFLPTTLVNFAAATGVPRLTRRFGNAPLLAGGLAVALIGMFWLSRLNADTPYLTGVALPMILIGMGQGAALGPLTSSGIVRVGPRDAGAASGVVNAAHQLGGTLGILVAVAAPAGSASTAPLPWPRAHRPPAPLAASCSPWPPCPSWCSSFLPGSIPRKPGNRPRRRGGYRLPLGRGTASTRISRDSRPRSCACLLDRKPRGPPTAAGTNVRRSPLRRLQRILMRVTVMYGAGDVRVEDVPGAAIKEPGDGVHPGYRAMASREALKVLVRP
ncbi:MFS transporter [Arthrobacter sp. UYCu723]